MVTYFLSDSAVEQQVSGYGDNEVLRHTSSPKVCLGYATLSYTLNNN